MLPILGTLRLVLGGKHTRWGGRREKLCLKTGYCSLSPNSHLVNVGWFMPHGLWYIINLISHPLTLNGYRLHSCTIMWTNIDTLKWLLNIQDLIPGIWVQRWWTMVFRRKSPRISHKFWWLKDNDDKAWYGTDELYKLLKLTWSWWFYHISHPTF